ncbi:MAG: imidazole glycerol phosphate synthase subunit HisH [Candidatus Omnitrophica bacterium]|nr:imidazole glycerol phosphate synthase subunit HisH [Candidatus Omnitrophota bacterium]
MEIVVIDYGLGNLTSVYNALKYIGAKAKISSLPGDIKKSGKLVLPGVGSFQDSVIGLKKRDIFGLIKDLMLRGKPYLGICLGLQILFEKSQEGKMGGFGIFKGNVKRFSEKNNIKVPHIGWNSVKVAPKPQSFSIMDGIENDSYFYFDHSYYPAPEDKNIIAATTDYGVEFPSAIHKDNIYAVQFHPERSQKLGLRLLENFVKL